MSAIETEVRAWLDGGGYLLEMEVAALLSKFEPDFLEQGYHYFDRGTGVEREGDVLASFPLQHSTEAQHSLMLVVECKNTTAPWIVFAGDNIGGTAPWGASRGYSGQCTHCDQYEVLVAEAFTQWTRGYGVTEKRNKNGVDHAYQAVQQAASALLGIFDPSEQADGHTANGAMTQGRAVVVTRSPLFVCTLGAGGEANLDRVSQANVALPRPSLLSPDVDGVEVTLLGVDRLREVLTSIGLSSATRTLPRGRAHQ